MSLFLHFLQQAKAPRWRITKNRLRTQSSKGQQRHPLHLHGPSCPKIIVVKQFSIFLHCFPIKTFTTTLQARLVVSLPIFCYYPSIFALLCTVVSSPMSFLLLFPLAHQFFTTVPATQKHIPQIFSCSNKQHLFQGIHPFLFGFSRVRTASCTIVHPTKAIFGGFFSSKFFQKCFTGTIPLDKLK